MLHANRTDGAPHWLLGVEADMSVAGTTERVTKAESLASALEREYREIDDGIARIGSGLPLPGEDLAAVRQAIITLRRHIYLEEVLLFPPLYDTGLMAPVLVMLREHGRIWVTLDALERALSSTGVSAAAPAMCRRLAVQLQHHHLKEKKILYPAAGETFTAAAATKLHEFLDAGDMPAGWICARMRRTTIRDRREAGGRHVEVAPDA